MNNPKRIVANTRKETPLSSKEWKKNLRRACLLRAVHRRRGSTPNSGSRLHNNDYESWTNPYSEARMLLEDEIQQYGIAVSSPCQPRMLHSTLLNNICESQELPYEMSEDEFIELLEEIERDIERAAALRLEEEIDRIYNDDQEYLEYQISQFEVEENNDDVNDKQQRVLCPLCQEAYITQTSCATFTEDPDLVCPNFMDGSCAFRLSGRTGLTTEILRYRLSQAYTAHSEYCNGDLSIRLTTDAATSDLHGLCELCSSNIVVL